MRFIWATRGRAWGFRFMDDGGFPDPLVVYDKYFSLVGDDPETCRHFREAVVLRFPDPLGRRDLAGRIIPHEFVVFPPDAAQINSVEAGRFMVWPEVADRFATSWALPEPPSAAG